MSAVGGARTAVTGRRGSTAVDTGSRQRRPHRSRWDVAQPIVAALIAAAVIGIPLWLVVVTSFKSQGEAQKPDLSLPQHPQPAANYSDSFHQGALLRGFVNSVLVVVPSTVLVLVLGAMAAWVFGRRTGKLVGTFYAISISGLLLPPAIITTVLTLRSVGLENTRPGMIAVYTGMYLSTSIFFITGFVRTLPIALEEAARIDGASTPQVFFLVVLPLLSPVIATATIMVTLFAWSDVFYAFFVLGGGTRGTLPLNLYQVANSQLYLNNWHLIFAYVVMMSVPMVALFLIAQRRVVSGITSGAVK